MIRIKSFAKPKGETSVGGYTINTSTSTPSTPTNLDLHYFWGQPYDGTQDVDGDLTTNGNISASSISTDEATITSGIVSSLTSSNASIDNLSATTTSINSLSATSGNIQSLLSGEIRVDNLTVTQAAHFFNLIVDEVKSTQGQVIITPANAELVFTVKIYSNVWKCYFRAIDGDGKQINNGFRVDDLVVCQTFNATSGDTHDSSNRFYWAKIKSVSNFVNYPVDGQITLCHTVDIDMDFAASNSNTTPRKGDSIVQLGNRTDTTRQSAIIISAYNNQFLDSTIEAPSIVQYNGINYFSLAPCRLNVISKNFNSFKGNLTTTAGEDVSNSLSQLKQTTSSITSTVTSLQGDVDDLHSEIIQTADNVKLEISSGLSKSGIDISANTITLQADKVRFADSTGQITDNIRIYPSGALFSKYGHFEDINASGFFTSSNEETWNQIYLNAYQGSLSMFGPDAVEDEDPTKPTSGADVVELFNVEFETDPDALCRYAKANFFKKQFKLTIDAENGLVMEGYSGNAVYIDALGISYYDEHGQFYSKSWQQLLS